MVSPAPAVSCLSLPPRARGARNPAQFSLPARVALAARIAELTHIETVDVPANGLPPAVEVYLQRSEALLRKRCSPALLCHIDHAGIVVHGLDERDRHHLLSRRWGRLHGMAVQLYLPRDDQELDVCWSVLRHAYERLVATVTNSLPVRTTAWPGDLTELSRPSLS